MNLSYELSCQIQKYIIIFLIILVIPFLIIPIYAFLPSSIKKNFGQRVSKALLKLLRFIWRLLKLCLYILLAVVIIALGSFLWPVYLGILILRPQLADYILSRKIF